MTLVVGATGALGGEICARLRADGVPVRALVRSGSPLEPDIVDLGVEPVSGDLTDPPSLEAACSYVRCVVSTASAMSSRREGDSLKKVDLTGHNSLVRAAKAAGVEHFVYTSISSEANPRAVLVQYKRRVERVVRESGMTWTVLQPAAFMETMFKPSSGWEIDQGRVRIVGPGTATFNPVSRDDVAEFAALSVAIGSSATGARSYTATASQGLLFMAEAVYNASGLGLPIVMTVGNRAIGAPINIWNDQSDSMALRDAGWIQLYAESNQQAVDVHIQAFRIAEALSLPVMVCMDGFILTHAFEGIDVPIQEEVDRFLPSFEPRQVLDPREPISLGAMVGPEAFTEVRYLAHHKQMQALNLIPQIAAEFQQQFGRRSGGLLCKYRNEDAETIVITLGSVIGTVEEVIDEMRDQGHSIGAVTLRSFRPFPHAALLNAIGDAKRVVVLEKSLAVGMGGIVSNNVHMTLHASTLPIYSVIAGLGGRPITRKSLHKLFQKAMADDLDQIEFLDLKCDVVKRELEREEKLTRSGSIAENILRDLGVVDAAKTA